MFAAAIAILFAAQEPPRFSIPTTYAMLPWLQCVSYGAEDMLPSDRTTEELVDLSMGACQQHEGRMRDALRAEGGRSVEAELPRFRDFVRDRAITRVNDRRQRPAQAPAGEAPH